MGTKSTYSRKSYYGVDAYPSSAALGLNRSAGRIREPANPFGTRARGWFFVGRAVVPVYHPLMDERMR